MRADCAEDARAKRRGDAEQGAPPDRDRELAPDVVVPRRHWSRSLRELTPFLRRDGWRAVRFPVRDTYFNNVPELSRSRFVPEPHRFETPATDDPDEQLVIYLRDESAKRTGTSTSP